jgi:hypothetical protein
MSEGVDISAGDFERAASLLRGEGLNMPAIPAALRPRFVKRHAWCFSTRTLPVSPYDLQFYVDETRTGSAPEYALVAHAGHGSNSYAMHYFLVDRRLRLFVKIGWGGVYMDKVESTALVNECFELAGKVVQSVREGGKTRRLSAADRVTVIASDFDESVWRVSRRGEDAQKRERIAGNRHRRGPREALMEALDWCSPERVDLFGAPG